MYKWGIDYVCKEFGKITNQEPVKILFKIILIKVKFMENFVLILIAIVILCKID